jgi:hypothetical protein
MSETKKLKTKDGSIVYYVNIKGVNKMHSFDGPAYLPQGNRRAAEYYVFGIKFTKDQFDNIKKDNNGVPFYKTAAAKATGARV